MTRYSTEPANALVQLPNTAAAVKKVPALLDQQYQWFSQEDREAEHHALLEGALLAAEFNLDKQIAHYKRELHSVLTHDIAARTAAVVSNQTGYQGFTYHHANTRAMPQKRFTVPGGTRKRWVYQRLHDFGQFVPPQALRALALVSASGIVPDSFWVADKKEEVSYSTWRSLDPILCAQFGRWFVGIAEWLQTKAVVP